MEKAGAHLWTLLCIKVKNKLLLVSTQSKFYSFLKNDILEKLKKYTLEVCQRGLSINQSILGRG